MKRQRLRYGYIRIFPQDCCKAKACNLHLQRFYLLTQESVSMQKQDYGDHSPTVWMLRKCLLSLLLPRRLLHLRLCPVLAQNHIFLLCQNAYNPSAYVHMHMCVDNKVNEGLKYIKHVAFSFI